MSGKTSELGGRIRTSGDAALWENNDPLSVASLRLRANNANHYLDEAGQLLVCYPEDGGRSTATDVGSTWEQVAEFGPVPILIDSSGIAYPVRVRLHGASTSTNGEFAIVQCGEGLWREALTDTGIESSTTNVLKALDSTGSSAWLTLTDEASTTKTVLQMDLRQSQQTVVWEKTPEAAGGGAILYVKVGLCWFYVLGRCSSSTCDIELNGLYCSEFVGP